MLTELENKMILIVPIMVRNFMISRTLDILSKFMTKMIFIILINENILMLLTTFIRFFGHVNCDGE